jgi:hypothetical protein
VSNHAESLGDRQLIPCAQDQLANNALAVRVTIHATKCMFDLLSDAVDSRSPSASVPAGDGSFMESVETLVLRRIKSPFIQHIETDSMISLWCGAIRSGVLAAKNAVADSTHVAHAPTGIRF